MACNREARLVSPRRWTRTCREWEGRGSSACNQAGGGEHAHRQRQEPAPTCTPPPAAARVRVIESPVCSQVCRALARCGHFICRIRLGGACHSTFAASGPLTSVANWLVHYSPLSIVRLHAPCPRPRTCFVLLCCGVLCYLAHVVQHSLYMYMSSTSTPCDAPWSMSIAHRARPRRGRGPSGRAVSR